ncbi:MAG TPA: MATE family efflux transporter [Desulfomonilia bacterium]|nr:MATE family efflux transporter [Desulfomonilia bacterium]
MKDGIFMHKTEPVDLRPPSGGNPITAGSTWSAMWRLTWPMLLIMVMNFFVGFTDIYVAGLISREVQAAIGYVSQLYFLFIILGNAISIGTVALVSRAFGARVFDKASEYAKQSLIFGLAVSILLMALGVLFHAPIVRIAGFPLEIRTMAETFLVIFSFALGSNYILIISNGIFRASGEVMKPLLSMSVFCAVNIFLDFALVFGLGPFPTLGYPGIAYSTAIAATVSMVVNIFFFSSGRWRKLLGDGWAPRSGTILLIARLGWPACLLQIAWNAGTIILYHILTLLGSGSITALASITNGLRIEAVIFMPAFAMNMAASVLVGQNLGAGNPGRAASLGWKIALAAMAVLTLLSGIIFIQAEFFASFLSRDTAVLAETARYLRVNMLSEPFMALSLVLGGSLQGAGDTKGNMWVIIFCMWVIRLPLAYALAMMTGLGAFGVWIAMVVSMFFQGVLMAYRFHQGKWRSLKIDTLTAAE